MPPADPSSSLIRLNKLIADSGYCARRKADLLITAGRVQVNGQTITTLGHKAHPHQDRITIDGQPLPCPQPQYLAFHKPTGTVTSRHAGQRQTSIYALLPSEAQSADPAGRLDQDSSGLLILSTDGAFLHRITHPRYHLEKVYRVTTQAPWTAEAIQTLQTGLMLHPENKLARMTQIETDPSAPNTYRVTLITGYNRQIRRSLAALGYQVEQLIRLAFGPVTLGDLPVGACRALSLSERRQLQAASAQAGASTPPPSQGEQQTQQKP